MEEREPKTALEYIQRDIADIKKRLDDKYITRDQFDPIRNVVYGFVGMTLVAVITALLALVIKGK